MKYLALLAALLAGCSTTAQTNSNVDPATLSGPVERVEVIPAEKLRYEFFHNNRPAPTVMLGHGCAGIVGIQTKDYVNDLLRWGFNVVVVDSWTPRGIRTVCKESLPYYHPPSRMREFYDIAEIVKKNPYHSGKFGYIGWSHGGSLGLSLAGKGQVFNAVVSYYPGCGPRAMPSRSMRVPTLMHLAEKDTWTPIKYCDNIDGNVIKMVHPNSVHAFDIRAPYRVYKGEVLEYNERADRLAREATHRFLKEFLQ